MSLRGLTFAGFLHLIKITALLLSPSPVNADGAEIEDAGRAHHDVQSHKDVTVDLTEAPLAHHLGRHTHTPPPGLTHTL